MKIAIITQFLPERGKKVGGVSIVARRVADGLAKLGHEVTVYSVNPPAGDALFRWEPIVENPVLLKLCRVPVVDLFLIPLLLIFVNFSFYDILHFHGHDTFFVGKRPRVRTMHGSSFREFQHTRNRLRKLVLLMCYAFEWISVIRMNDIFCIGSDTARMFQLDSKAIISNPVDLEMFYPGEKTAHPQIFYNGYWKGRKRGHFIYQKFIEEVLPHCPEAKLVFLGDECPPHPQVDLIKGATDQQLAQFYRESWVFAYPSIYEGFGLAYVEAMASGTAVLASPNSGADDVLEHGKFGVISDDSEFGPKLRELVSKQSELRASLERSGLDRSKAFAIDKVALDHSHRFEKLLARFR